MQQLLAWWLFNIRGWKIEGKFHFELPKSIMIVAPHTHWVDFFIGLAVRKKLHFEFVHFLGKSELFWPPLGWLLRNLGAYPVDRQQKHNMVDQVVEIFNKKERFHLALSPEGTRKKVTKLRSGFYHIAKNAHIPIVTVGFDFAQRRVVFAEPFFASADEKADKYKIVQFFKQFKGYIPEYGITEDLEN
jgi:1-acyl-sn-glycerol-3-phosphate acyltransferase